MTMKALVTKGYGTPDLFTIAELPIPEPAPGQIQVRISAASLNPADLLMTEGTVREMVPLEFPYVLGTDFAGTVTKLAPDVDGFDVGDEVFGFGAPPSFASGVGIPAVTSGAIAEYAVFQAGNYLAHRPTGLNADVAAALPSTGMTGLAVLEAGAFQPGDKVLVIGAAGGIGTVVVPLLARKGNVEVIATASAEDADYVRALGAHSSINYLDTDLVEETLRHNPGGVDAIVNLALKGEALLKAATVIRPGGRLLSTTPGTPPPSAFDRADLTVSVVMGTTALAADTLSTIATYAVDGTIPDPISKRYQLHDAIKAYTDLAIAHTRGKLVISIE